MHGHTEPRPPVALLVPAFKPPLPRKPGILPCCTGWSSVSFLSPVLSSPAQGPGLSISFSETALTLLLCGPSPGTRETSLLPCPRRAGAFPSWTSGVQTWACSPIRNDILLVCFQHRCLHSHIIHTHTQLCCGSTPIIMTSLNIDVGRDELRPVLLSSGSPQGLGTRDWAETSLGMGGIVRPCILSAWYRGGDLASWREVSLWGCAALAGKRTVPGGLGVRMGSVSPSAGGPVRSHARGGFCPVCAFPRVMTTTLTFHLFGEL